MNKGDLMTLDLEKRVSATRTASCKDSRRNAMLRHDQALKESLDEVAKAGFRAGTSRTECESVLSRARFVPAVLFRMEEAAGGTHADKVPGSASDGAGA